MACMVAPMKPQSAALAMGPDGGLGKIGSWLSIKSYRAPRIQDLAVGEYKHSRIDGADKGESDWPL